MTAKLPAPAFTPLRKSRGFTLVELLVSMVILLLLMLLLVSITNSTSSMWVYTTGRIEEFHDAREAFESITRCLSQATLNTYWDYNYPQLAGSTQANVDPTKIVAPTYVRQSELRFISGPAATLIDAAATGNNTNSHPGHAIFFQAPLGQVNNAATYSNLDTLLNTWGFFVEYGDDSATRPAFFSSLSPALPLHYRFRVLALREPSDTLTLYGGPPGTTGKGTSGCPYYNGKDWYIYPLFSYTTRPVQVLAENVVALIILPKLSPTDEQTQMNTAGSGVTGPLGTSLAPKYLYDSTATDANNDTTVPAALDWKNQMPPVVQVTMVAVDEASFKRLNPGATMPNLGLSTLFQNAANYQTDLDQLQANLLRKTFVDGPNTYTPDPASTLQAPLNFHVFTSNVEIKSAKWSRDQTH